MEGLYEEIYDISSIVILRLSNCYYSPSLFTLLIAIEILIQIIRIIWYLFDIIKILIKSILFFIIHCFSVCIGKISEIISLILNTINSVKNGVENISELFKYFYYTTKHINDSANDIDNRSKSINIKNTFKYVPYNWNIISENINFEDIVKFPSDKLNRTIITTRVLEARGIDVNFNINWDFDYISKTIPIALIADLVNLKEKLNWSIIIENCENMGVSIDICDIEHRDKILGRIGKNHPVYIKANNFIEKFNQKLKGKTPEGSISKEKTPEGIISKEKTPEGIISRSSQSSFKPRNTFQDKKIESEINPWEKSVKTQNPFQSTKTFNPIFYKKIEKKEFKEEPEFEFNDEDCEDYFNN